MNVSAEQRMIIETRVANEGPNILLAYVLWLFLGFFSAHRFYLVGPGSAILQFLLNCIVIGLIWTLIDAFLIPGMVERKRRKVRKDIISEELGRDVALQIEGQAHS